ncbi:Rqc2 family fibronectin-binding protein [Paenibacillus eucommiae]|uniref:Rqc2 homolog RqcH n=1 Tax=Paenibacillus eucommiae TaxID=1355755 RepID=A0ABS4JCK3_9BACL|nr:NFACT RNA binding domain-containing protein [Paenibacillus eucommiae]MBP1996464.1 putative ribosome quality control (RQC) complex YloA/Tae2 family protein [Paenibacillus eucommiae]
MALDGLVLHAVVHELKACIGGRINKIHQHSENEILLHIRAQGQNLKLLLSANPTYPRIHFTEQQFMNPMDAPMFCMLLRKHCENGVIEAIEQMDMERMIHLHIRQRDELGDISLKTIIIEIMGRHSNIILIDSNSGTILDGIHHVTPAISSYRIVMPGSTYTAPPAQHKLNPLHVSSSEFREAFSSEHWEAPGTRELPKLTLEQEIEASFAPPVERKPDKLDQRLVAAFSGLSPLAAKEIIYRSGQPAHLIVGEADIAALWEAFSGIMGQIREHKYEPNIVEDERSGKPYFAMTALTHIQGTVTHYATAGECLESFYGNKAERDTVKQRVSDLIRFLQNEKNKNVKKLEKLQETLQEAKGADQYRILGELLTASLHQVRKGDKELITINYYDEEQADVRIPLDPQLSPSQNAQRFYKKYTKMKSSMTIVEEQMTQTRQEILYVSSLLQQLDAASLQDIEEIRDELAEQGYVKDRRKKQRKKKKQDKPKLSCFTSREGILIYVGKNNTQNEYLTNRLASASDTWLHTKDIPGSHVVIRSDSYSDETLLEAAQLAAYFSQAKASSQVPVDYTLIRHVHKPNGAKPGFVIYVNQKTLYVTPDEQQIKQMTTN